MRIYVDDELASESDVTQGAPWVSAPAGAWVTVTHLPSGIGAAVAFSPGRNRSNHIEYSLVNQRVSRFWSWFQ